MRVSAVSPSVQPSALRASSTCRSGLDSAPRRGISPAATAFGSMSRPNAALEATVNVAVASGPETMDRTIVPERK